VSVQDADIQMIAGASSAIVLGDELGNVFRIQAQAGQLNVTKNGVTSAAAIGGILPVATKTASYSVTAADSGTWFNNKGASGTVVFTLPAVATSAGCHYRFTGAVANQIITVTAPAGTLVTYGNAAATSVSSATAGQAGHGFEVICDGAFWYAAALMYVTANTTVA
jgi:hypothetical protein